ncbi:PCI-domain-containing protein [Artomyces pyxidatus]|uniref:PCI-domain-containing protein n=1 Tax=Artomyces pyxidatus TaxID=48021 RepID=A0ACB8TAW6_9AGAM|nr:PCI-domain-containing protein [Artomyces pyxidatus]
MAVTDSISIFAEGTFEDQIVELASYVALSRPEPERASYIQGIQESLQVAEGQIPLSEDEGKRRDVFSSVLSEVKTTGEGSEREIEGFFNLLYAHLLTLWPADSPENTKHVSQLLPVIVSSSAVPATKYRILSNLFNALPRTSALRLSVYRTLLDLASSNDELDFLQFSRADIAKWLQEWDVSSADKSAFLKNLVDLFTKAEKPDTSYHYRLAYVRSLDSSSPDYQSAAIDTIAIALSDPSIFDFDALFKLDAVVAAKSHPLFQLLQVYLNGGLEELKAWQSSHSGEAEKYGLESAKLERKIRLLSLAALGFENIGSDLPYPKIAATLQVDPSQVEKWAIDVIRAGLLTGKLSQTTQTLHVTRATARAFGQPQWELLAQRLAAWRLGLGSVLEVVAGAKKKNEQVAAAVAPDTQADEKDVGSIEAPVVQAAAA